MEDSSSIPQKCCIACKGIYPATTEFFYKSVVNKDGLMPRCIKCRSDYMRKRYAKKHPNAKPRMGERITPPENRVCKRCGQTKPGDVEHFKSHPRSCDGLSLICRECINKQATQRARKRYLENPPIFSEDVLKKCTRCERELPAISAHFHLNKRKRDGLNNECRDCKSKRAKEDRLGNPEKHQWRQFMYRSANRETIREKGRDYARRHRAEHNARWRKRDATLKQNGGIFTAKDIQGQFDEQEGKCYWCGKELKEYHVDHVIPVIRGGSDDPDNIVLSCPFCNQSKGSKSIEEWLAYLEEFILPRMK